MFDNLFQPITIRGTEFRNRIKMPGSDVCLQDRGYVTDEMIDYQVARARGGCGLNTIEATSIHAPTAPEELGNISEDKFMPGFTKLCKAIHEAGGKCNIQLDQGGISTFYVDPALPVFIPSAKPEFGLEGASLEFMEEVKTAFADSAARAAACGFDAVELHLSHGYGLHGFLSGAMNRREDEYGGSLANRARYPLEVIQAVRKAIPDIMPVFLRIAPFDDYAENGLSAEDVIEFCKWAKEAGADALDVSRGNCWGHGSKYIVPPMDLPRGFNIENAARLKRETDMVVAGVGRINDPQQAEEYIASGKVDIKGRGHTVILAEQDSELGGLFRLAGAAPGKQETLEAVRARAGHVVKAGVDIRLNAKVTPEALKEIMPDEVVLATGGSPIILNIPGADRPNVIGYKDILQDKVRPKGHIVVIGGGLVGIETAEYLCDGENNLTVVEMAKAVAKEAGGTRSAFIEEMLDKKQITYITRATAVEIKENSLVIEKKSGLEEIPADYIIVAVGSRPVPQDELLTFCKENDIPAHLVGDALKVGVAIDAIADAAALARKI